MTDPHRPPTRSSRCWTLHAGRADIDVEVSARDDERLGAVLPALGRALGVPDAEVWSGSHRLVPELPLTAPELAHGAILGLGRPGPRKGPGDRSSALELHVVGGPDSGRTLPLGSGTHVLGRGADATVRFADPDVSRRHARVQLAGGGITVADLDSTNGSLLGEETLGADPRPWPLGAVLRLGASAVTVSGPAGLPAAVEPASGGRARLRPTARMVPPHPDVDVAFPRPLDAPPRRPLAWVAVVLPAVGGLLLAWLLRMPAFLLLALLSPVVAVAAWLSDRWTGRRTGRRQAAEYTRELLSAEERLLTAITDDRRAMETAHPDLATVTTAARRRSSLLWSRRREDAAALVVRLGSGRGPTRVTRVEADGSRLRQPADHLPVVLDLRAGAGLGVLGPRDKAMGCLRSIIAQLTALHPPGEVELALVTSRERLGDWSWARWLPHLAAPDVCVGPREGTDDDGTSWFRGLLGRRRAAAGDSGPAEG